MYAELNWMMTMQRCFFTCVLLNPYDSRLERPIIFLYLWFSKTISHLAIMIIWKMPDVVVISICTARKIIADCFSSRAPHRNALSSLETKLFLLPVTFPNL